MKTSNKLLLTFALALICSSFISLLLARQNMVITKSESIVGNNNVVQKKIQETVEDNTLILKSWNEYYLDVTDEGITMKAEENIIPEFATYSSGGETEVDFKPGNTSWNVRPEITFGISNKDSLILRVMDNAELKDVGPLKLKYLKIESEDHTKISLEIDVDVLDLELGDNTLVKLKGKASDIILTIEGHAKLDGHELNCNTTDVNMRDNSSIQLHSAIDITGLMRDHSRFELSSSENLLNKNIRIVDHAQLVDNKE